MIFKKLLIKPQNLDLSLGTGIAYTTAQVPTNQCSGAGSDWLFLINFSDHNL